MCGVIVVDAGRSRSTNLGRDAYILIMALDIVIIIQSSINCPTVICLPTVCYFLREATSEIYGPRVYLYHINLPALCYCLCFYFAFILLCIFITKIPKILSYHIYQISLS